MSKMSIFRSRISSPRLLFKNIKSKIEKLKFCPFVCGCETWSVKLKEEHRLGVFENRVLRNIRRREDKVTGNGEHCMMRSLMICPSRPTVLG